MDEVIEFCRLNPGVTYTLEITPRWEVRVTLQGGNLPEPYTCRFTAVEEDGTPMTTPRIYQHIAVECQRLARVARKATGTMTADDVVIAKALEDCQDRKSVV